MSEETTREARGEGAGLGKDVPPQGAGAGAQAYPIRALVRADALAYPNSGLPRGAVIMVREDNPTPEHCGYSAFGSDGEDSYEMFFVPQELILNPTPEQIAEERAKLPPAPKARPAPAASAEPPSQSLPPSPTLEAAREAVAAEIREIARTHRVAPQMGPWSECGPLIKGEWLKVADRILSLLSPGREGQGTGMEPSAPKGLREPKTALEKPVADLGRLLHYLAEEVDYQETAHLNAAILAQEAWKKIQGTPAPSNGEEAC